MSAKTPKPMNDNTIMTGEQFAATHAKLASRGGFTVNPRTGNDITSGISVAPRGNEFRVPLSDSTPAVLNGYAVANQSRWTNEQDAAGNWKARHNASLGGWRSKDEDVLDTPTVYKDTPGGRSSARKNMVYSGQEAGYDLGVRREVPNPFHPKTRADLGMAPHELAGTPLPSMPGARKVTPKTGRARDEWMAQQPEVQAWINQPRESAAAQSSRSDGPRMKRKSS